MKTNGMQFCRSKSLLNAYAWWCHDSCKMWGWNMITDKCRNDMFIMILWRDAYAMHDMNAFYGHESPENYLFLLAHLGTQCPMCTIKKVIWTLRWFVYTRDQDRTHMRCLCKRHNAGMYTVWQYSLDISKRVYDTYAWQCEKWHAACLLRAPI